MSNGFPPNAAPQYPGVPSWSPANGVAAPPPPNPQNWQPAPPQPPVPVQPQPSPAPQAAAEQDPKRMRIGPVILSYPKLFVPEGNPKDPSKPPKYSGEFWLLDSNPHTQAIVAQINQVQALVWQENKGRGRPAHELLRRIEHKNSPPPGMTGWYFRANCTQAPSVLIGRSATDIKPSNDVEEFYAGAIVYCSVTMSYYSADTGAGLKFYLNAVMKVGDGARLATPREEGSEFGAAGVVFGTFNSPGFSSQAPPAQSGWPPPGFGSQAPPAQPGWQPQGQTGLPPWPPQNPPAQPGWGPPAAQGHAF